MNDLNSLIPFCFLFYFAKFDLGKSAFPPSRESCVTFIVKSVNFSKAPDIRENPLTRPTHCNTEREETVSYRNTPFVALPGLQIVGTSRKQDQAKTECA